MTRFVSTIDLRPLFASLQKEEITIQQFAGELVLKLAVVPNNDKDPFLCEIRNNFIRLSHDTHPSEANLNYILSQLTDWADQEIGVSTSVLDRLKKCWLITGF